MAAPIERSINSIIALVFGVTYTVVGVAGFFVIDYDRYAGKVGEPLIIFDVNFLHNIVHLLVGLGLIVASRRTATARATNFAIGVAYLALGALGPVINDTALDVFGLNGPDHLLHLGSGALLVAVALFTDKAQRARARAREAGSRA